MSLCRLTTISSYAFIHFITSATSVRLPCYGMRCVSSTDTKEARTTLHSEDTVFCSIAISKMHVTTLLHFEILPRAQVSLGPHCMIPELRSLTMAFGNLLEDPACSRNLFNIRIGPRETDASIQKSLWNLICTSLSVTR